VIISARRIEELEKVAEKCALVGNRPLIVPLDVLKFDDQEAAFQQIIG
jgi:NADP-dependent 3-hydroxy acid dehydrogenase YdfG